SSLHSHLHLHMQPQIELPTLAPTSTHATTTRNSLHLHLQPQREGDAAGVVARCGDGAVAPIGQPHALGDIDQPDTVIARQHFILCAVHDPGQRLAFRLAHPLAIVADRDDDLRLLLLLPLLVILPLLMLMPFPLLMLLP